MIETFRLNLPPRDLYNDYIHSLSVKSRTWSKDGACADLETDALYVSSAKKQQEIVDNHCKFCPVVKECLTMALSNFDNDGVWGRTTENERRDLIVKIRTKTTPFNWSEDSIRFIEQIVNGFLFPNSSELLEAT